MYPALALLLGAGLDRIAAEWPRHRHWVTWPLALLAALGALAAAAVPRVAARRAAEIAPLGAGLPGLAMALAIVLALAALVAWWLSRRGRIAAACAALAAGMGLLAVAAATLVLPRFDAIKSARPMAALLAARLAPGDVYGIYPRLDSGFLFYSGRYATELTTEAELREFLAGPGRRFLLAQRDDLAKLPPPPLPVREVARDADLREGYLLLVKEADGATVVYFAVVQSTVPRGALMSQRSTVPVRVLAMVLAAGCAPAGPPTTGPSTVRLVDEFEPPPSAGAAAAAAPAAPRTEWRFDEPSAGGVRRRRGGDARLARRPRCRGSGGARWPARRARHRRLPDPAPRAHDRPRQPRPAPRRGGAGPGLGRHHHRRPDGGDREDRSQERAGARPPAELAGGFPAPARRRGPDLRPDAGSAGHRRAHPPPPAPPQRCAGSELRDRVGAARLPPRAPGRNPLRRRLAGPARRLPRDSRGARSGAPALRGAGAGARLARSRGRHRGGGAGDLPRARRARRRIRRARRARPRPHGHHSLPLGAAGGRPRRPGRRGRLAVARAGRRGRRHAGLLGRAGPALTRARPPPAGRAA